MTAGSRGLRTPPRVFVSYRRNDSPGHAGRLHDALVGRFGADRVFMDVDDIPPGRDFTQVLARELDACEVLIALIGPTWAGRRGRRGRRRLDDPGDFVRMELAAALKRRIPVVPVLVQNASMPRAHELPDELARLSSIQAFELADRRWGADLRSLIVALERHDFDVPWPTSSTPDRVAPAAPAGRSPGPGTAGGVHRASPSAGGANGQVWGRLLGHLRSRRSRHTLLGLLGLLGLAVLGPVMALLIGWATFDVPSASDSVVVQQATFVYSDGPVLATTRPQDVNRVIVPLDQVPRHVRYAVLAAEDPTFYTNPGFDVLRFFGAADQTITEKYVRAAAGLNGGSLWTDYKVLVLAAKVSQQQSKDQILENYLNAVSYGRGAYGVQAASRAYFGKDAADLSVAEGGLLAVAIQASRAGDPAVDLATSAVAWVAVLDTMTQRGWITPIVRAGTRFPDLLPEPPPQAGVPDDSGAHVYRLAREELEARGITEQEIDTEGLTVELTVDSRRQRQAVDAVRGALEGQPDNLRGALVSVDPRTGAILAYYGGAEGTGPDYARAMRRPGSVFMPFVLAAALQDSRQGVGLGSVYDGSSPQTFLGVQVTNTDGGSCAQCTVQEAMTQSVDTVFYRMAVDTGPHRVVDAAHQAGIPADELSDPTAGIGLGDREVRPIDMASAFATFAADGVRRAPYLVAQVTASDGRVLYQQEAPTGEQAVPQQVARNVTESIKDVPATAGIAPAVETAVAGKTGAVAHRGVTGHNTDAWTVGYTPSVSTAVWVGSDTGNPILTSAGRPVLGRTLPGSIWQKFLDEMLAGTRPEQFSPFVPLGTPPGGN